LRSPAEFRVQPAIVAGEAQPPAVGQE